LSSFGRDEDRTSRSRLTGCCSGRHRSDRDPAARPACAGWLGQGEQLAGAEADFADQTSRCTRGGKDCSVRRSRSNRRAWHSTSI
jgi:hypothetical protein